MLVCPQCQFENPDSNKFCQKCGTALTHLTCTECDAAVPFSQEHCPNCGASNGVIWRAIITPKADGQLGKPATVVSSNKPASVVDAPSQAAFLDAAQRYQILDPPSASSTLGGASAAANAETSGETTVTVLDRHPFQLSLLHIFERQDESDITQPLDHTEEPTPSYPQTWLSIPAIAQIHLELHQKLYPSLASIHDAWEDNDKQVLLLEDLSDLPRLADIWGAPDVLTLQILHWMHEMTEFWVALQAHQCCQTLLELENLKVDEDQVICLQRLLPDPPGAAPSLRDLGALWQTLFLKSQRTQLGSLAKLCMQLEAGELTDVWEVRSQFEAIAKELESDYADLDPSSLDMSNTDPTIESAVNSDESPAIEENPFEIGADLSSSALPTQLELCDTDEDDVTSEGEDLPTVVLPMRLVSLDDAGCTDVGRQREHNEDYFSVQTQVRKIDTPHGRTIYAKGLYILCDGMGGHAGGEVASALAVETLQRYFEQHWQDRLPNEDTIRDAIDQANRAIFDLNQQSDRSGLGRMGTTLLMLLIQDTHAVIAHVGDSRLYSFSRRQGLEQMTTDHEVGQREIQRGVEPSIAYARPDAFQLTQALGPRDENFIHPDVQFIELNEDVLLLLCSDGLTDNDLLETHWSTHVEPLLNAQTNLDQGVNQLIHLANQYNGHDNITAIAVRAKVRPNLDVIKR